MAERGWTYQVLKWVIAAAALVFAAIWFLSAVAGGFTSPDWVPPTGLLLLAVAVLIP